MMALHLFQQPLSSGSIASISSSTSSLSSLQTPSVHNCVQLLPPALSLHLHRHCQNRRRRRITGLVFVGKEETQLRVVSTESDDDDPNPQHLEYVFQIKRVLELLRTNRDMIFSEVKLTIMIEDQREVERRRLLGIDDSEAPTREDLAAILEEVHEGKVPKNRVALRTLAEEMAQWPNLEVEVPKKKRGKSLYAKATDTGINPEVAAKRLNIDWDTAANIEDSGVTDDTEVPSAVGYGALYLVTAFPVIIGISVVLILFYNSLQ
ncbi:ycf3-interacting protein 1, chloroplastic-like isoform X1 [Actinidia eriantha]|uniref:ycf3-interacting protein 1, chloroplastic-like isoform X1 n=1 Tax=Actinidia eriantha TaxID=165200 RepID=UPI0025893C2D|nr:ycf3-interacting protein 1, chloroplastic-like isoform X1 [Actinidia eriantha]